jgi:hypothetical protein
MKIPILADLVPLRALFIIEPSFQFVEEHALVPDSNKAKEYFKGCRADYC